MLLSLCAMALASACHRKEQVPGRDLLADPRVIEFAGDRVRIDIGEPEARLALQGEWFFDKNTDSGPNVGSTSPRGGLISFRLLKPAESELKLRCRSDGAEALVPVLNGHNLAEVQVGPEWTETRCRVKKTFLRDGENLLFLKSVRRAAAIRVDYMSVGPVGWDPGRGFARRYGPAIDRANPSPNPSTLVAPPRGQLSVYAYVPARASLSFEFGIVKEGAPAGAAADFSVGIEDDSGRVQDVSSRDLSLGLLRSSHDAGTASLDELAGRTVRILMRSERVGERPLPKSVYWRASIIAPERRPDTVDRNRPGGVRGPVVIYLVDALRADRLEPYGYSQPTSPRLTRFARDGIVFRQACAQSAWTRASVASIMTGLYASSHLVEGRRDALPVSVPTLPALLKEHGFATYAFVTNGNISAGFGFGRHFDEYIQLRENAQSPAIHVFSSDLFSVIESHPALHRGGKPVFIYVHATDPHAPHVPGPGDYTGLPACAPEAEHRVSARNWRGDDAPGTAEELRRCALALYDREVRHSDFYFGRFLDMLKKRDLYDDALIFFTADHGESFGEHDKWGHGKTLYQPELRVPLIVKLPQAAHPGRQVGEAVRQIDILPTIADVLGIEPPAGIQGRSLLEELDGPPPDPQPAYSELVLGPRPLAAMVFNGYKLIAEQQEEMADYKLYDLPHDPGESRDVSESHPVTLGFMKSALRAWTIGQELRKRAIEKPDEATLDPESEEVLRKLGYIE
ncbi:MAG: sulfatase [Acidobacteria bacterium]|nr:sulfatase [Acidobacteriota bacterium]